MPAPANAFNARATLGYIGSIQFLTPTNGSGIALGSLSDSLSALPSDERFVRASSIDLTLSQTIEKPDLIDRRFDKTLYQLGPLEVGGGISFPAVHEEGTAVVAGLWESAMIRSATNGNLTHRFNARVKYAGPFGTQKNEINPTGAREVSFDYTGLGINEFGLSVSSEDLVTIDLDTVGVSREKTPTNASDPQYDSRNSRIVTWNDFIIGIEFQDTDASDLGVGSDKQVFGARIRDFNITVANNISRFYSLNQRLFPVDVAATVRDISGSFETLGRLTNVGEFSRTNRNRCAEFTNLFFGYQTSGSGFKDCSDGFFVLMPGVVFEIEEMTLGTDLFVTTVNYHVLPGAPQESFDTDFLASGTPDSQTFTVSGADTDFINPNGGFA